METTPLNIEQIRQEFTWRLRRSELYPNKLLHEMEMDEDNNGWHFGAFCDDALVGVVSLFQDVNDFQFRKFAVAKNYQGKGIGMALLQYITRFAINEGGKRIWCNARINAKGFYAKAGFDYTMQAFTKNGFDYEVMQKSL